MRVLLNNWLTFHLMLFLSRKRWNACETCVIRRMVANDGKTVLLATATSCQIFYSRPLSRNTRTIARVKLRSNGSMCVASYFKTRRRSAWLVTKRVTLFPCKSSSVHDAPGRSFSIKSARFANCKVFPFILSDEIHRGARPRLSNAIWETIARISRMINEQFIAVYVWLYYIFFYLAHFVHTRLRLIAHRWFISEKYTST